MFKPERKIDNNIKIALNPATELNLNTLNTIAELWSIYLNKDLKPSFTKLLAITKNYSRNDLKLKIYGKPHMEGMVLLTLSYAEYNILSIPLSFYLKDEKEFILIHTIQGFKNSHKILSKFSENLSFKSLAIFTIEALAKEFNILLQHPEDNFWHKKEMEYRKRELNSREFSIYENVIVYYLKNYYKIKNIAGLYEVLNSLEYFNVLSLEAFYIPFSIECKAHPTLFLSIITKDTELIGLFLDLENFYNLYKAYFKEFIREIRYLAPPGFEPGSRGPEPRILDH